MSAAWSLVALVTWVVLPSVAAAALMGRDPRPASPVRVHAVSLTTGLCVWFLGSELLARLELLTTTGAVVTTVVVGVAALVVIFGPGRSGLPVLRSTPLLTELGIAAGAAIVATLPLIILVIARRDSLSGPTPWYYFQLARDVVGAHGFPATSAEWATRLPFLDDYPGFTSGTALLMAVGGTKSMAAVPAVRLLTLAAVGALSAYLFARSVGAVRSAAAVSVVVLLVGTTYAGKLGSYRPEATGYVLVFLVAALAKLWMDERRNVDLVLATVALLTLSEVHGIGWLFAALIVGGIGVAGMAVPTRRRGSIRAGVVLAAASIGGWLLGNLALGGGLSGAGKVGGLPDDPGVDPTWRFVDLVAGRLASRPSPSVADVAKRGLDRGVIGLDGRWYLGIAIVVVLLLVLAAWRARVDIRRNAQQYSLLALLVVSGAVAISSVFALRWDTYVPLRTGWGRLFPLTYALIPAAIALVITAVANPRVRIVAAAVVFALGVGAMVHARTFYEGLDNEQPTREALGGLRNLDLTRRDLVLTNGYSEGFVAGVLGSRGVLDGRAPYSEPKTLARANELLEGSIRFFADPINQPIPGTRDGTNYILVATKPTTLGTSLLFPTDFGGLDQRPDLRLVRSGPGYILYEVQPTDA